MDARRPLSLAGAFCMEESLHDANIEHDTS